MKAVSRGLGVLAFAALAGCHAFGGGTPGGGGGGGGGSSYAVTDALAVGDGARASGGTYETTFYAPQPAGRPVPAQSLSGEGQIVYGPDGSLYRYTNAAGGCTISKYAFGAVGGASPTASASGDPHLTGTAKTLGCFASATDLSGNVYVLVANGSYLGIDVFDPNLVYRYQLGNGRTSGIVSAGGVVPLLPLAVDANGSVYVGEGSTVAIFTSAARGDASPSGFLTVPLATVALAFDQLGDLFVANATAVNVYALDATGGYSLATSVGLVNAFPTLRVVATNAVAVDSLLNLYVLTADTSGSPTEVLLFPATAGTTTTFGNPTAIVPVTASAGSIAVAPAGALTPAARRRPQLRRHAAS